MHSPVDAPPDANGSPDQETASLRQTENRPPSLRRRGWVRWIANLLIAAGVVVIPLYYGGSCAYTWLQQRGLFGDMAKTNPQVTLDVASYIASLAVRTTDGAPGLTATSLDSSGPPPTDTTTTTVTDRFAELLELRKRANAYRATVRPGQAIGRLVIPAIDLDVVMVEGTGKSNLKEGPGHWPETPFPGQGGNFVVSGHRTTYGAPFRHLDKLKPGDRIYAVLPYVLASYEVMDVIIVYPDEVETVAQRGREQISLAACHPLYSARQRIVVRGDLVDFVLLK
ncbi:MAG: class E sortase [Thermoleophilia bacterium]|nr:class E sortase [Thermoleophilia bacterium]